MTKIQVVVRQDLHTADDGAITGTKIQVVVRQDSLLVDITVTKIQVEVRRDLHMADGSITATDKIQVEVRQDLHMADGFITVTHKECGLWSDRMYIQQFHHCGTQNADCGETGSTYSRTSWEQTSFGW